MTQAADPPKERRRAKLWPALRARPRLLGSVLLGIAVFIAVTYAFDLPHAVSTLIAWNAGAVVNLVLTGRMAWKTDVETIKRHAISQDQGRLTILVVVILASAAVMLAVGTQLSQAKDMEGYELAAHLSLAVLTVVTSWLFTQAVFALHYAHDFYSARIRKLQDPLTFPGTKEPQYMDFFYFAVVIGTSAQTADVSFNGSGLRLVGALHCIASFFFNASLLALSINVVAGALL